MATAPATPAKPFNPADYASVGVGIVAGLLGGFAGGVQRQGDISTGGGVIVGPGHSNILVNGRPAAKPLDVVTPHWGCSRKTWWHCVTFTTGYPGSKTVRANGQPLVVDGDYDTCFEHKRMFGSSSVKAR